MSKSPGTPSYGDLTALVAEQAARLVEYERRFVEQGLLIEALQVEVEALRRKGACCAIAWRALSRPVRGLAGPAWVCSKVKTLTLKVAHSVRRSAVSDGRGVWAGGTCPWRPGRGGANGTGPAGIPAG